MKSYPGNQKTAFSGFVIPETGELFTEEVSWFNFESTISSLRNFLKHRPLQKGQKYYLVMDNAPWHRKAKRLIKENVGGEFSDLNEKIVFVHMPPYSPDLNPIELVWKKTRKEVTHNRFFPSVQVLKDKLIPFFLQFFGKNHILRTLCSFKCFEPLFLLTYQR